MNKELYLQQLRQALIGLPPEEIESAISYYEEYFDDAGVENEQTVIAELGKPAAVAAQIRANAAMRELKSQPTSAKKGISAAWLVVLAVLASPIALPVAIAILAVFFALLITIFAVVFALGVSAVAVTAAGVSSFAISFVLLFSNIGAGLFGLGGALACTGIGLLLGILTLLCMRGGFRAIAYLLNRWTQKRKGRINNE